jgi:hypothetical protein
MRLAESILNKVAAKLKTVPIYSWGYGIVNPLRYARNLLLSLRFSDQHAIAVAVEAISRTDGTLVGCQNQLPSSKGTDQHK